MAHRTRYPNKKDLRINDAHYHEKFVNHKSKYSVVKRRDGNYHLYDDDAGRYVKRTKENWGSVASSRLELLFEKI